MHSLCSSHFLFTQKKTYIDIYIHDIYLINYYIWMNVLCNIFTVLFIWRYEINVFNEIIKVYYARTFSGSSTSKAMNTYTYYFTTHLKWQTQFIITMHEHVHTLFWFVLFGSWFPFFVPVYALATAIDAAFIIDLILHSIRWERCKFSGVSNCLLIDFLRRRKNKNRKGRRRGLTKRNNKRTIHT